MRKASRAMVKITLTESHTGKRKQYDKEDEERMILSSLIRKTVCLSLKRE